jgi:hypothetical protein
VAGAAGLLLLVDLFAAHWYVPPAGAGVSGWDALSVLRWLLLVTAVGGIGLAFAQARLRAPAVPVTLAVVLTILGLIATIALIIRVLLDQPGGSLDTVAGGYVGLAAAAALLVAGLMSLRQEGILERDGPGEIPTLSI